MNWAATEGTPLPLGVTWIAKDHAYNFAIFSEYAESVTLFLYGEDSSTPLFSYVFDHLRNKSGRVWHCRIPKDVVSGAQYYAYRVSGPRPSDPSAWHRFDPEKILLDPYATSVFFPSTYDRSAAARPGTNAGKASLGFLCACESQFDWSGDRRPRHESDTIIYEMHVRAFTRSPTSGVPEAARGTYVGVIEKIPYLKELGITAVELMPVLQNDPQEGSQWGYMPLNFFAPEQRYARSGPLCGQHDEFREMVKALHQADIEVILDVVYNHTSESDGSGPTHSFRGIDNATYYLMSRSQPGWYEDFAGTGNTLNCAHRAVRRLILDSLRHWARDMRVDGFRFDLASIFTRNVDGSINFGDPLLAGDVILEIDGQSTEGFTLEEATKRLKGEEGTQVTLTVVHPGRPGKETVTLTREIIHVETVLGDQRNEDDSWDFMLDDEQRIGYVRLTAFSRDTASQLQAVIEQLRLQGLRALILDLRFNPGGLLRSAIEVSDMFVAEGTIVSTEGRNSPQRTWKAHRPGTYDDFPMVVLVNRYSASASEIVAACLQDHHRAVIMGERTWGKGSVQNLIELEGGRSALKLTTAAYQRPSGKNIHRFPDDTDDLGDSEIVGLMRYRRERDIVRPHPAPAEASSEPAPSEDQPGSPPADSTDGIPSNGDSPPPAPSGPQEQAGQTGAGAAPPAFVDRQLEMARNYLWTELARADAAAQSAEHD